MARPANPRQTSSIPYLEPPHSHDPTAVAGFASLPSCMLLKLPESVVELLWTMQEAASVAFASYQRLRDLDAQRAERTGNGHTHVSECAFFNYQNQLKAEKDYLLGEALPDWRQKAAMVTAALAEYADISFRWRSREVTVRTWWDTVKSAVAAWANQADEIEVPEMPTVESQPSARASELLGHHRHHRRQHSITQPIGQPWGVAGTHT